MDRAEVGAGVADCDLSGRTVLVTGSTDGIGREAALSLGRLGARVVVHGRDSSKGEAVVDRIGEAGGEAVLVTADFADLDEVREMADAVSAECDRLDVLVNNAGAYFSAGRTTDDGYERTIQVNHLAPYLLTQQLSELLSPQGRVVTTSSRAHRDADVDFESFRTPDDYSGSRAYSQSKLANVLFTYELADRLDGATANCLHPGAIPGSGFVRNMPAPFRAGARLVDAVPFNPLVTSVTEGAETVVYLAASPEVAETTGAYFVDCEPRETDPISYDQRLRERLWAVSAEMTGVDPDLDR